MKKNRPAVKVCTLCRECDSELLQEMILRESSSLGVRKIYVERSMLARSTDVMETSLGPVRMKSALMKNKVIKEMPEFEDIRKIASARSMPLSEVRSLIAREREEAVRSSKPVHEDCEAKLNLAKRAPTDRMQMRGMSAITYITIPIATGMTILMPEKKENDTDP